MKKYLVNFTQEIEAKNESQAKRIAAKQMSVRETAPLILAPMEVFIQLEDIRNEGKEHFVVFHLDTQSRLISRNEVSTGTLNESLVHPREVFRPAIHDNSSHIIIAHNHPSGGLEPSEEDIAVTKRLQEAGKLLGIEVIDHIIVTQDGYMSFKEKLLMEIYMKLYYHKTDGGAEYLFDTYIKGPNGHKEGTINDKTRFVVRIDGDITKDAELTIREK